MIITIHDDALVPPENVTPKLIRLHVHYHSSVEMGNLISADQDPTSCAALVHRDLDRVCRFGLQEACFHARLPVFPPYHFILRPAACNHQRCAGSSTDIAEKVNNKKKSPTASISLERAFASRDQRKSPIQAQIEQASPELRVSYWHSAAETGHAAMLAEIVQYHQDGFDVDQLDNLGVSALHKAAAHGHYHVCKLLVKVWTRCVSPGTNDKLIACVWWWAVGGQCVRPRLIRADACTSGWPARSVRVRKLPYFCSLSLARRERREHATQGEHPHLLCSPRHTSTWCGTGAGSGNDARHEDGFGEPMGQPVRGR